MSQMKPRSGLVTDGLERAPARGMLRAVGMGDEDWVKPQIGIASSWNEITPCNLSLDRLAKASKQGVFDAGGFPMQFAPSLSLMESQWATKECTFHLYLVK